jgi:hypothetical protein
MSEIKQVQLMTTLGCHLCEDVQGMLGYLMQNEPVTQQSYQFELVEISEDENLLAEYGVRIPVLVKGDSELGWPFDYDQLKDWLGVG